MTPYPFMICHCQTDTKTAGTPLIVNTRQITMAIRMAGFFNCNIMGEAKTLKVKGAEHVKVRLSLPPPVFAAF